MVLLFTPHRGGQEIQYWKIRRSIGCIKSGVDQSHCGEYGGGVRTRRVPGKDPDHIWQRWGGFSSDVTLATDPRLVAVPD